MVKTDQIRERGQGTDRRAPPVIYVGKEHAMFSNVFFVYDTRTGQPCGCWGAAEIEADYPTIRCTYSSL